MLTLRTFYSFVNVPYLVFTPPKLLNRSTSGRYALMALCSVVYFISISGIPYDILMSPPPFGLEMDESGGFSKPVAFMQWEINHQYILEGLFSAVFILLGALGMMILLYVPEKIESRPGNWTKLQAYLGLGLFTLPSILVLHFFSIKWPFYIGDMYLMTSANYDGNWVK